MTQLQPSSRERRCFKACDAARRKLISRQVAVSKTLDRCSEETLYFNIQVEKSIIEEVRQFGAYSGLADAADTSEEYAHVAILDGSYAFSDRTLRS